MADAMEVARCMEPGHAKLSMLRVAFQMATADRLATGCTARFSAYHSKTPTSENIKTALLLTVVAKNLRKANHAQNMRTCGWWRRNTSGHKKTVRCTQTASTM